MRQGTQLSLTKLSKIIKNIFVHSFPLSQLNSCVLSAMQPQLKMKRKEKYKNGLLPQIWLKYSENLTSINQDKALSQGQTKHIYCN